MYDYLLGGKDNFEADRVAAEKVLALVPGLRRAAVENRRFLRRVVRFLAAEVGISQFLDIGVGLPTQGAVHEVAREINPRARVVYVDYDPVVVSHGQALLAVTDLSIMVQGDLRRPAELLARPEVRAHLDFGQPVAIGLFAILHFLRDADDPAGIVASLRDAVAPGSYLVISHIGTDFFPAAADAVAMRQLRRPRRVAAQRHGDRCRRGLRQAGQDARRRRCLTARRSGTGRWSAFFTERVRGTRSWDAPAPVAGWAARDVVRHLTGWFPGFLASGAGIELP